MQEACCCVYACVCCNSGSLGSLFHTVLLAHDNACCLALSTFVCRDERVSGFKNSAVFANCLLLVGEGGISGPRHTQCAHKMVVFSVYAVCTNCVCGPFFPFQCACACLSSHFSTALSDPSVCERFLAYPHLNGYKGLTRISCVLIAHVCSVSLYRSISRYLYLQESSHIATPASTSWKATKSQTLSEQHA